MKNLKQLIKSPNTKYFRKAFIKRRLPGSGLFEPDWQEITKDVKSWGKVKVTTDPKRPSRFKFDNMGIKVANDEGLYNPETDEASLWFGFVRRQRSLLKIEVGYLDQTLTADGIWINNFVPGADLWDVDVWDDPTEWDNEGVSFHGLISGDMPVSDKNQVSISAKPLQQVFLDFPADLLTGYTSTGLTASQFIEVLRDQTDGAGAFVFRPFFGDTTSNWNISATTNVYATLNTTTSKDVIDKNAWQVIEKLAEAENFVPFVGINGVFNFTAKTQSSATSFEFYGKGQVINNEFGHTIKRVSRFGPKLTSFYSRVQVKFKEEDTNTSFATTGTAFQVAAGNLGWELGYRSFQFENLFIQTSTVANTIAQDLFTDFSSLKNEIEFTTNLIPQLSILNKVAITYDTTPINPGSSWDLNNWASATSNELTWDISEGDAIRLNAEEFKLLSIDINLDKLDTKFIAREL